MAASELQGMKFDIGRARYVEYGHVNNTIIVVVIDADAGLKFLALEFVYDLFDIHLFSGTSKG